MVRRGLAGILAALTIGLVAGPAFAYQTDVTDPGDPSQLDDQLLNNPGANTGIGEVNVDGRRGTAQSSINMVRVTAGSDLDLRVLDTDILTTTDHRRVGEARNVARAEAAVISAFVNGVIQQGGGAMYLPERAKGESYEGSTTHAYCVDPGQSVCTDELPLLFPTSKRDDLGAGIDWDNVSDEAGSVMRSVETRLAERGVGVDDQGMITIPLPSGRQSITVDSGEIIDAIVAPARIAATLNQSLGEAGVASEVSSLDMLSGLGSLKNAGPGTQETSVSDEEAVGQVNTAKIDRLDLLQLDALLKILGLDADMLPDATLAAMADALGLRPEAFANGIAGAAGQTATEMVAGIRDAVSETKKAVSDLRNGKPCDQFDSDITNKVALKAQIMLSSNGAEIPSCLGLLNTVDAFVSAAEDLQERVHDALSAAVGSEALIHIEDLSASILAQAKVDASVPNGYSLNSHATGGIKTVSVGDATANFDLDQSAEDWNRQEQELNDSIRATLGALGDVVAGSVRVQFLPWLVQTGEIEAHQYVKSMADMALFKVTIDLPSPEDLAHAVDALLEDVEEGPGSVGDTLLNDDEPLVGGVPGVGGGAGGAGGTGPYNLARADATEPITIVLGEMSASAEYIDPDVTITLPEACRQAGKICSSANLLTQDLEPRLGLGNTSKLPKTGGASGTLPIGIAAGLSAVAYGLRRFGLA